MAGTAISLVRVALSTVAAVVRRPAESIFLVYEIKSQGHNSLKSRNVQMYEKYTTLKFADFDKMSPYVKSRFLDNGISVAEMAKICCQQLL